jgi:DtxR family transcriptional regulator, Mn-dependent transcriptional regulator
VSVEQNADLSASLEDYLEAIFNLGRESNMARSKDIAKLLGVSRASVTGALKSLAKKGLVNYRPYGCVTLTESGLAQAANVARKHDIIESFFMEILGIGHSVAHPAACKAEHLLHPTIVSRMGDFASFVRKQGQAGQDFMSILQKYTKTRGAK